MHPILFSFDDMQFRTYTLMAILAMFGAMAVMRSEARRRGWNVGEISWLTVRATGIGFVSAHIVYAITRLDVLFSGQTMRFLKLFINFTSGEVWFGGFIGSWYYVHRWTKKNGLNTAHMYDAAALCIIIAQAVGRIGCFFGGCCYGSPTDLPWAYVIPTRDYAPGTPLHPFPIYEMLYLYLVFIVLWRRRKKVSYDGQIFVFYVIAASIGRFALEFTRGDTIRGFAFGLISTSQLIALGLIPVAIAIHFKLRRATS